MDPNVMLVAAVCVSAAAAAMIYQCYRRAFSYWKERGIDGPRPLPFLGNMHQILFGQRPHEECEWRRRFGRVYGVYRGSEPHLVLADAELVRQITTKDFDLFPNHEKSPYLNKYQKNFIISLQDGHWRRVRAMMTPTFTSGKMKRMYKLIDLCADDLVQCFAEQLAAGCSREPTYIHLKKLFSLYTLDAIASCCYALRLERASAANERESTAMRNRMVDMMLKMIELRYFRFIFVLLVPAPVLKWFGFSLQAPSQLEPMLHLVERVVEKRRQTSNKYDDYLQLLLDAKLDDNMELDQWDQMEQHHVGLDEKQLLEYQRQLVRDVERQQLLDPKALLSEEQKQLKFVQVKLTDVEILTNAVFMLFVGLETTATLLTNCFYALAFHSQIQEKLRLEVSKLAQFDATNQKHLFDYEQLISCHYLDAVICEVLRLLSPVLVSDRVAAQDYWIEVGGRKLLIPRGSRLLLAYHAIMNDPDYWPEPEKFDPTRFMPENRHKIVPGSYCPFGLGPRHCIGMRFSLTEAKLGLAKLLMKFQFQPAPDTKFPPQHKMSPFLYNIKNPTVQLVQLDSV